MLRLLELTITAFESKPNKEFILNSMLFAPVMDRNLLRSFVYEYESISSDNIHIATHTHRVALTDGLQKMTTTH